MLSRYILFSDNISKLEIIMIYTIDTLEQLKQSAIEITKNLQTKEVFLLTGPLGAGKSTWIRYSLEALGYNNNVPSPTFSLHHIYDINNQPVHHIDLYRIRNEDELESFGFRDILREEQGWIFIEWAERISINLISDDWKKTLLHFDLNENNRRLIVDNM